MPRLFYFFSISLVDINRQIHNYITPLLSNTLHMKIGIVGPADRAVAWEEHMHPHRTVKEVVITAQIEDIGEVDACLILDETENKVKTLLKAIRMGYHSFLVSSLPTTLSNIEKIYHTAEEANVLVQFAHWPTFAPASQWMSQKVTKPTFLHITREISYTHYLETNHNLDHYWVDELAYCLKWIDGNVHHIDVKSVNLQGEQERSIHLFLRFDSGATANIFVNACSSASKHQRFAADQSFLLECDVLSQTVRMGKENDQKHLFFEKQTFDASKAAEIASTQFLKAIQLNKSTLYNGYDLLKLANVVDKIKNRLS